MTDSLRPPGRQPQQKGGYGTFFARLAAYMIDTILLVAVWLALVYVLRLSAEGMVAPLLSGILTSGYFIYCHGRWGATAGKKAMSLRVISIDGKPLSMLQSFVRYSPYVAFAAIDMFLPDLPQGEAAKQVKQIPLELRLMITITLCWYSASVVYMLNRRDRRTLHDVLAYTVVIEEPK